MGERLTEWNVNDYLKSSEERAMFIEAATEEAVSENDPGILSDALVAVIKSIGGPSDRASAVVHREDGSFWAEVPALPGCYSSGDTLEELRENLRKAISFHLEGLNSFTP